MHFAKAKKHPYWKNVSQKDWNDWHWQMKNRVGTAQELGEILKLSSEKVDEIHKSLKILRMAITPYYLSQIDLDDPNCPIRLQAVPQIKETEIGENDMEDPLHEEADCPVKGLEGVLTHRYPDRLIMYVTYQCSMYCRHCTRRRHAGETDLPTPFEKIQKAIDYIAKTKTIRDVLITGGDPLILETEYLEKIIKLIRDIPHVEIIRLGTRVPVVMPMRIDEKLIKMLRKYHPIWMNTHFNHPKEMTDMAAKASNMIADGGIPLGNQTVLMRGVNNHPLVMKKLMKLLVANRIRPYYIYQCDMSQGISHFRTRISEGIEIIENLRGHMSGFAVPTFCVDGLGGGGKTPLLPNYVVSQSNHKWVFRNYEGLMFAYTEPTDYTYEPPIGAEKYIDEIDSEQLQGVAELLSDKTKKINIVPSDLRRLKRRR